jgi:hypothetical protein
MGHIACKSIYVRVFAGTDRMHKRDVVAVGSWLAIAFGVWVVAWIIASSIPAFNSLLSIDCASPAFLSCPALNQGALPDTNVHSHCDRSRSLPAGSPLAFPGSFGCG